MICDETTFARLEWQEAKYAIRRQKEEITLYGSNLDRRAMLKLMKLRAKMWKRMVPMNIVVRGFAVPRQECPVCHSNIPPILLEAKYCRWCGQRLQLPFEGF